MRKPNSRELAVLREFSGTSEPWGRFAGAGPVTLKSLLDAGWIRQATDPSYPDCCEIAPAGEGMMFCWVDYPLYVFDLK